MLLGARSVNVPTCFRVHLSSLCKARAERGGIRRNGKEKGNKGDGERRQATTGQEKGQRKSRNGKSATSTVPTFFPGLSKDSHSRLIAGKH